MIVPNVPLPFPVPELRALDDEDVSVKMIVEDAMEAVEFAPPLLNTVPVPVIYQVLVPIKRVRTFELLELQDPQVTVKLLVFNVPFVSVSARSDAPDMLRLSCSVHPPPTPLNVIGLLNATPFMVMVFPVVVAVNVRALADVGMVIVGLSVKLPATVKASVSSVPENPVKSRSSKFPLEKSMVSVPAVILTL